MSKIGFGLLAAGVMWSQRSSVLDAGLGGGILGFRVSRGVGLAGMVVVVGAAVQQWGSSGYLERNESGGDGLMRLSAGFERLWIGKLGWCFGGLIEAVGSSFGCYIVVTR